jgi:hypothetical protein
MTMKIGGEQGVEFMLKVDKRSCSLEFVREWRMPLARQVVIPGFVVEFLINEEFQNLVAGTLAHQYLTL